MLATLLLALACGHSHAQTAAPNASGPSAIPKPLYTQLTEGKPQPDQDAATAKAINNLRDAVQKANSAAGISNQDTPTQPSTPGGQQPASVKPEANPAKSTATPEEEAAAKYLMEQSKKMKEALKDMELSN